jgi:CheY-like chemotaxis protein
LRHRSVASRAQGQNTVSPLFVSVRSAKGTCRYKPAYNLKSGAEAALSIGGCGLSRIRHSERIAKVPQNLLISIIDDDEAVRAAVENLVRSLGLGVTTFASAEDFLKSSRLGEIACVITDVHMPGMTGVELQSSLLAQGHNLPMIFITAFPEERTRDRVNAAGAIGFLSKPFDCGAMIACIDQALAKEGGRPRHL